MSSKILRLPASMKKLSPADTVGLLRATYRSGKTRPLQWRKRQLQQLEKLMVENNERIKEAMFQDLGRHPLETSIAEYVSVVQRIQHCIENFETWAEDENVGYVIELAPISSWVRKEPKGVVLAITPWNYPFNLPVDSIISPLAAGNCVLLKPSEMAPYSRFSVCLHGALFVCRNWI